MSKLYVYFNHQVIGEHDYRAQDRGLANGDLVITDPDGTVTTYPAGTYHATGSAEQCGNIGDDPNCPRCHPPAHGA